MLKNNPESNSLKVIALILIVVGAGYLAYKHPNTFGLKGDVYDETAVAVTGSVTHRTLYLAGGSLNNEERENENDVWSSTDGINWTLVTKDAAWEERYGFGFVHFKNKLWVFGGVTGDPMMSGEVHNDVWASNDGGLTWIEAPTAPWEGRYHLTALVFNNKMWVMGGRTSYPSPVYFNDVWYSSDGVTWTEATAAASFEARARHSALVFNNKMWIMGGWNSPSGHLNDVWSSSDGVTWNEATSSAAWGERGGFASVVFKNKMWVFGGEGPGPIYNDVWSSSDGVTWNEATSDAAWIERSHHRGITFNSKIFLYGGIQNFADVPSFVNDTWWTKNGTSWTSFTPTGSPFSTGRTSFGLVGV